MTDPIAIIKAACESMMENGFYHSSRIVERSGFDLSEFHEQKSDISGVEMEYVCQDGGGMTGDDFHGTIVWPINERFLFVCEY
jgi:hypothetical protein